MTIKRMMKEHLPLVKEFNIKFWKTEFNYEVEYCLYMEEYAELCEAYRKKDKYKIFDTLVDLYYYSMFKCCTTGKIEAPKMTEQIEGWEWWWFTFEMLCYVDWEFWLRAPLLAMKMWYDIEDFDSFFQIVHQENLQKLEVKDGKIQKGAWREERDEAKKAIVDSLERSFS